jgi:hypothetical protein
MFQGEIIAAGAFHAGGGQSLNHVARYRGGKWQPLGAGLDGEVYALAVFGGVLVAGGQFFTTEGHAVGPVAAWDGESWRSLGIPASGLVVGLEVRALLIDGESLVAAGDFSRMGSVAASRVARWNGSTWSAIGSGFDDRVDALDSFRGELIAGGAFTHSGDSAVAKIARWTGLEWSSLGSDMPGDANTHVYTVAEFRDTLYAGGVFTDSSIGEGPRRLSLLRCGGVTWDTVPGAWEGETRDLLPDGDSLIVVGRFYDRLGNADCVRSWDGNSWSALGATPWPMAESVIRQAGKLLVGGNLNSYWSYSYEPGSNVVEWNGSRWGILEDATQGSAGLLGYVSSLIEYQRDLVAAGSFRFLTPTGWSPTCLVARWDGSRWSEVGQSLNGVAYCLAVYKGDLIVGGNLSDDTHTIEGIARWDGVQWDGVGTARGFATALSVWRDTLYVAGQFGLGGTPWSLGGFEGGSWRPIAAFSETTGFNFDCLAVHGDALYASGYFDHIGSVEAHYIARWDGGSWHPLGAGTNAWTASLASADSELVVGGLFSEAGGSPAQGLALWDGSSWHSIPSAYAGLARSIVVSRNQIFVSADILLETTIPGGSAGHDLHGIARFDGSEWHALGSGVNGRIWELAEMGGSLWACGEFTLAGGKPSYHIARWDLSEPDTSGSTIRLGLAFPNPFSAQGTKLRFVVTTASVVHLSIHDLSGREVAKPIRGTFDSGPHTVSWAGDDANGRALPAGVYFARLKIGDGKPTTARLVLIK